MAELTQVYKPTNSVGKPRIVFLHGLDGHFQKTWMSNSKDESTLWPQWLGEDTGCPVWLLSYASAMSRWKADAMALPRQGTAVLECLGTEQALTGGPVVLVGHSLGGLVIKTALQQGLGLDVERHGAIARNVKGVAFVGTPHFGSFLATIAARLHFMRANPQVSDLQLDDAYLEVLNRFFLQNVQSQNIGVRIYTETQPVRLPWWALGRFLPGVTIVSPTSSLAHVPGEAGIPIEADHISICKPRSRSAALYKSMLAFVKDVEKAAHPQQHNEVVLAPLRSDQVQSIDPSHKPDSVVHLAVATFGFNVDSGADAQVATSVCLVTDDPERLRKALQDVPKAIISDPLVNEAAKQRAASASLKQLYLGAATRGAVRRILEVMSFSAYLYYCPKDACAGFSAEERARRLLVEPLLHRLSKKGVQVQRFHTHVPDLDQYLVEAVAGVEKAYHRTVTSPVAGESKYSGLEELASLLAWASSKHLSNLADEDAGDLFEGLRTRIRYAENVATGEKHKRDVNPLP